MGKTVVITTTIRVPTFLEDVCKNAIFYNRKNISYIMIGDKNTPAETQIYCEAMAKKYNFPIHFYTIEEQEEKLKEYPKLLNLVPYKTGVRKLIGNFIAYMEGYEKIIMLDDDNFMTNQDFFGYHGIVGDIVEMELIQTASGWYNVYNAVREEHNISFYPRSYPWSKRSPKADAITRQRVYKKIAVNNGLILEDPDIDAISRLFWPIRVVGMKSEFEPRFGLYPGTWSSFNNQNTAICRDIIPIYFTPIAGGRNSDIWSGYVICRLTEHMGDVIAYGYPLVRQFRNYHNLWVDLEDERIGDRSTDIFVEILRSVVLTKNNYLASLGELLEGSLQILSEYKDISDDAREMMDKFFLEYKVWHDVLQNV